MEEARNQHQADSTPPVAGRRQGASAVPGSGQAQTVAGQLRIRARSGSAASRSDGAAKRARVDGPGAPSGQAPNQAAILNILDSTRASTSRLLQYARPYADSQIQSLAQDSQVDREKIEIWLKGMCAKKRWADHVELAACTQVVLASCMNAILKKENGLATVQNMLAQDSKDGQAEIVQRMLKQFTPQEFGNISDKDWKHINKTSRGFNLLALVALSPHFSRHGHTPADMIRCAKASKTCLELVALCDPETNARPELENGDLLRIVSHDGGWLNLEAAHNYMDSLSERRKALLLKGYSPDEIDEVLKPVALTTQELVRIVSHCGGSHSLAAYISYVKPLFDRRVELCMAEKFKEAIEQAPDGLSKAQLVETLSVNGGAQSLAAAESYVRSLSPLVALLDFAAGPRGQIDDLLAPVTLTMDKVVSMFHRPAGATRLAAAIGYLEPLFKQRVELCIQGNFKAAGQVSDAFTKDQLVRILAHGGGEVCLAVAQSYLRSLSERRRNLALKFLQHPPEQIDKMLAPVTLNANELFRILFNKGGLKRLEAAIDYLEPLFEQRMALCDNGQFQEATTQPLGDLTKDQLVSDLSTQRGADKLAKTLESLRQ